MDRLNCGLTQDTGTIERSGEVGGFHQCLNGVDDVGEEIGEEEIEQMVGDVPCLPVFEIEPNPFDGKRKHLGMSNLLTPFVSNGGKVRSADTGNEHRLFGRTEGPGTVV